MIIALIAHDKKKDEMVEFAKKHKETLAKYDLVATGTTGKRVEEATGLPVKKYLSGPYGGDQQLGGRIAEGKIGLVVFFRDFHKANCVFSGEWLFLTGDYVVHCRNSMCFFTGWHVQQLV